MERTTISFETKLVPIKALNKEFTLCKCYVMALDKNRNFSYIGEEAVDKAMPTLANIPVIGHLYEDENGEVFMGGHDIVLAEGKDGALKFKSMCVPYGVVPESNNAHYEELEEPGGRGVKKYLVSDVILWTGRYPELSDAVYNDETLFGQSMEINVLSYEPLEEDKNYTNILDFSYSALCLLGKSDDSDKNKEPCFPLSRVDKYTIDDKFAELMEQLKYDLASCFGKDNEKGGGTLEDEVKEEVFEASNETEEVKEEFTEIENVETETKEEEVFTEETPQEEVVENEAQFSSTYGEKRKAIQNALPTFVTKDDDGKITTSLSYWLCDFNDEFVYVEREYFDGADWDYVNGRFAYTFEPETADVQIIGEFEKTYVKWLTADEVKALEEKDAEFEALASYKADRETSDKKEAIDSAISEFEYLGCNDEFKTVYENRYNYESVDELKNACYIIKGKYSIATPSRGNSHGEPQIPVGGKTQTTMSLRERFHEAYGKK